MQPFDILVSTFTLTMPLLACSTVFLDFDEGTRFTETTRCCPCLIADDNRLRYVHAMDACCELTPQMLGCDEYCRECACSRKFRICEVGRFRMFFACFPCLPAARAALPLLLLRC